MFLVNVPRTPLRALFLFGTGTPWKEQELGTIAHAFNQGIAVMPLNYFALFHSAVEDKDTALENLKLKISDVEKTSNDFRKGGPGHEDFLKALKTNDIRFVGKPEMLMDRIYVIADDTTTALPKDIWQAILPELRTKVVEDSLKASPCPIPESPDVEYMSVADIGPILSSIGPKALFELIQEKASELPAYQGKPVIFYNQVSCAVTGLGAQGDIHTIPPLTAHSALQVRIPPKGEKLPIIPTSENFSARIDNPSRSIAEDYASYLLVDSPRSKIYELLLNLVYENEKRLGLDNTTPPDFSAAGASLVEPKKLEQLKIVQPSAGGNFRKYLDGHKVAIRAFIKPKNATENQALIDAKAMEFTFDKKIGPEHPDAIIFAPFNPNDKEAKLYNLSKVRDAFVAKALNPAMTYVPIIIMNYNGCYDDAINSHIAYAANGYNKEFVRPGIFNGLDSENIIVTSDAVEHIPFQFCDVLNSNDWDALDGSVFEVLKSHMNYYHRAEPPQSKKDMQVFKSGGHKRDRTNHFGVTVFASASSDRKADNDNAIEVGKYLRDIEAAMIMGGGDQHTMGSLLVGYDRANNPADLALHLTCVSTHDIVKVETINGHLPVESDYWELHRTIGPRIETLMKGDMFISVGGGDGTGQETNCVLSRIFHRSPQMNGKKMVFIGTNPSMHAEMASIIGPKNLTALLKDPYALDTRGVYLFRSVEDAKPVIKTSQEAFYAMAPAARRPIIETPQQRVLYAPAY